MSKVKTRTNVDEPQPEPPADNPTGQGILRSPNPHNTYIARPELAMRQYNSSKQRLLGVELQPCIHDPAASPLPQRVWTSYLRML
jgi:hypothetical protein